MWREKLSTLYPNLRSNILPLFLGVIGLILLSYGLISSMGSAAELEEDITFEQGNQNLQSTGEEIKILVDVQGAIVAPGVYSLDNNARIKDALIQAGGFSSEADREWISKNLNQAAKLIDGAKIYIPKSGEVVQASSTGVISASGLININSASQSELESLPRIGPVTANKIIDGRPYATIEDLRSKNVVGQGVFDEIKEKISVY